MSNAVRTIPIRKIIFGISDSIVQRAEFDVGREYRGVFYKTTDNISLDTIKGIMKTRYE